MATKQKRGIAYQIAHTIAFAVVAFVVIVALILALGELQDINQKMSLSHQVADLIQTA